MHLMHPSCYCRVNKSTNLPYKRNHTYLTLAWPTFIEKKTPPAVLGMSSPSQDSGSPVVVNHYFK